MKKRILSVFLVAVLVISSLSAFTVAAADGGDTDIAPQAEYPTYYTMTTDGLNMRTGPGTNYSLIQTIPAGGAVEVGSLPATGWAYVYYNGKGAMLQENTLLRLL